MDELKRLAERAGREFSGWTWPQDFGGIVINGSDDDEGFLKLSSADIDRADAFAMTVEDAALEAKREGRFATRAAAEGRWEDAVWHAARARDLEYNFGDSPAWQPFLNAVRSAAEAAGCQV